MFMTDDLLITLRRNLLAVAAVVLGVVSAVTGSPYVDTVRIGCRGGTVTSSIVVGGSVRGSVVGGSSVGEEGVAGVFEESTVSVVPGELDESLVSPGSSPGVLYEDEAGSVSDSGDGVVGSAGTGRVLDDSLGVLLELVGHLEGDGKSSGGESLNVGSLGCTNGLVSGDLSRDHVISPGRRFARTI